MIHSTLVPGNTYRAPKQWYLGKDETVNSFENWRKYVVYTLSLDPNFSAFLVDGVTWDKKTKSAHPLREFTDDDTDVAVVNSQSSHRSAICFIF